MPDYCQLLQQTNEIGFVASDLNLYLDTHPTDDKALDAFSQATAQRKQLPNFSAREYEPLILSCVCPETGNKSESHTKYPGQKYSTWSGGPLPWDYSEHQDKRVSNHVDL